MSTPPPTVTIEVCQGDPLAIAGDALVVPTVMSGAMRSDIAAVVRERVGDEVEARVMAHAPIAVGAALVTAAGDLPAGHLIHAPIVEAAGHRIGVENIRRCTRAALLAAVHHGFRRVVVPAMGVGEGNVPPDEAARAMVDEIVVFKAEHTFTTLLVAPDEDFVEGFAQQLEGK